MREKRERLVASLVAGLVAAVAAGLTLVSAWPADAQSVVGYCVRCTGPVETHICTVTVQRGLVSISEWQGFCAARVAADAGHRRCYAVPGTDACKARQQFAYRSMPDRGVEAAGEASASAGPPRSAGALDETADFVQRTGRGAGKAVEEGAESVGRGMRRGAEAVGETANDMGREIVRGAERVGDGLARGVECVFTLGRKC